MSATKILGPDGKPALVAVRMSAGFVPQPLKADDGDTVHGVAPPLAAHWLYHPMMGAERGCS